MVSRKGLAWRLWRKFDGDGHEQAALFVVFLGCSRRIVRRAIECKDG